MRFKTLLAILITAGLTIGVGVFALPSIIYNNTNIQFKRAVIDVASSTGTSGQVFSSTGTSTLWIDASAGGTFTTTSINGAPSTTFNFFGADGVVITTSTNGITFTGFQAAASSTYLTISASTSFPNLATVGTITAGIWNATLIGTLYGGTNSTTIGSAGCVKYSNGTAYDCTEVGTLGFLLMSNASGRPVWINSTTLPYLATPATPSQTSTYQMNAGGVTLLRPNATSTKGIYINNATPTFYAATQIENALTTKQLDCFILATATSGVRFDLSYGASPVYSGASTTLGTFTVQSTTAKTTFSVAANIPQDNYLRIYIQAVSSTFPYYTECKLMGNLTNN